MATLNGGAITLYDMYTGGTPVFTPAPLDKSGMLRRVSAASEFSDQSMVTTFGKVSPPTGNRPFEVRQSVITAQCFLLGTDASKGVASMNLTANLPLMAGGTLSSQRAKLASLLGMILQIASGTVPEVAAELDAVLKNGTLFVSGITDTMMGLR